MTKIRLPYSPLTVQGALATMVLVAVTCMPSSKGLMLVLPLTAMARPAATVTNAGGLIVAAGAVSGSVVVRGDLARILPAAIADGDLIIAAGQGACSEQKPTS